MGAMYEGEGLTVASDGISTIKDLEASLSQLLQRAREVKKSTTINPALQAADFESHLYLLDAAKSKRPSDTLPGSHPTPSAQSLDSNALLETAARNVFYPLISNTSISEPSFIAVWNLLDIINIVADRGYLPANLSLILIEELLDSQTISGCRRVFDYLESRREMLVPTAAPPETKDDKKGTVAKTPSRDSIISNRLQIVLRTCNELLRRLSRAEDAVFCGRVFIFLFQSFPLGHKSSVNLRGDFHTENVTIFDETVAEPVSNGDEMDVDTGKPVEEAEIKDGANADKAKESAAQDGKGAIASSNDGEEEIAIDILYGIFWSLQHVFSNPTKIFAVQDLEEFKRGLALTLRKFKSMNKVVPTHSRAPADGSRGTKRKRSRSNDEFASNFNPKYLTSRDLFELEMSDLTFQRHILVQALITLDFLLSLTPRAKVRLPAVNLKKDLLYAYTLQPADEKWALETRSAISSYLQDGPDGKFYYRMADTVLARDKNWVRWKLESCPSIVLDPVPSSSQLEALESVKRTYASRRLKAKPLGAVDMSFVSDTHNVNGLDTLRGVTAVRVPDATQGVRDVETIDLDLDMADGDEKTYLEEGRITAVWKCLRVAARKRFRILDFVDEEGGLRNLLQEDETLLAASESAKDKASKQASKEANQPEVEGVAADGETTVKVEGQAEQNTVSPKEEPRPQVGSDVEMMDEETKKDVGDASGADASAVTADQAPASGP